jgi:signal transduction histidine kinase
VATLTIQDDGVGITRKQIANSRSLGVAGMRERALQWNGRLRLHGQPGKGTSVTLQMPLKREDSEDST